MHTIAIQEKDIPVIKSSPQLNLMKYETQHLQAYANEMEMYLSLDNGVRYPTEESIYFQNPYNESIFGLLNGNLFHIL